MSLTAETTAGLVLRTELKTGKPQRGAPGTLQVYSKQTTMKTDKIKLETHSHSTERSSYLEACGGIYYRFQLFPAQYLQFHFPSVREISSSLL